MFSDYLDSLSTEIARTQWTIFFAFLLIIKKQDNNIEITLRH